MSIGPLGPTIVELADVTSLGIIAISGSPALPVHPHRVTGLGDSTMNALSGTVAPSPGKTIGVLGRGRLASMPRMTSSVAPDRHCVGVFSWFESPKPLLVRLWRRMPIAWNGPVIHRSMWLRAVAEIELETATLPLFPALSPPSVYPGRPGISSWLIPFWSM